MSLYQKPIHLCPQSLQSMMVTIDLHCELAHTPDVKHQLYVC